MDIVDLLKTFWFCKIILQKDKQFIHIRDIVLGLAFIKAANIEFGKNVVIGNEPSIYINSKSSWDYLTSNKDNDNVLDIVEDIFGEIRRNNKSLDNELPMGLYKTSGLRNETISKLIVEIDKIDMYKLYGENNDLKTVMRIMEKVMNRILYQ